MSKIDPCYLLLQRDDLLTSTAPTAGRVQQRLYLHTFADLLRQNLKWFNPVVNIFAEAYCSSIERNIESMNERLCAQTNGYKKGRLYEAKQCAHLPTFCASFSSVLREVTWFLCSASFSSVCLRRSCRPLTSSALGS